MSIAKTSATAIERQIQRDMLLTMVSCEDQDLYQTLSENYETVWCMSMACNNTERFLNTRLGLIEIAQGYTRNMVDIAKSQSSSQSQSTAESSGFSDSQAQRTSQARNCGFADSTSFQRSVRDAESTMRSQGDAREDELEREYEEQTDRSRQSSQGYATSYNYNQAQSVADNEGYSVSHSERLSLGHTRTGRPGTGDGYEVDIGFPGFDFSFEPPYVTVGDFANSGYSDRGARNETCEDCGDLSEVQFGRVFEAEVNRGRSWNYSVNITLAIPIGTGAAPIQVNWVNGGNYNQSHTMTSGRATSGGSALTHSEGESTSDSTGEGGNTGHDESETIRDMHRIRDRVRDRLQTNKAVSRTLAGSRGESQSQADSESHNESKGSGQGTAHGRNHSESMSQGTSTSRATSSQVYWSQIFQSLAEMWKLTLSEIKEIQDIQTAAQRPAIAPLITRSKCKPVSGPKIAIMPMAPKQGNRKWM